MAEEFPKKTIMQHCGMCGAGLAVVALGFGSQFVQCVCTAQCGWVGPVIDTKAELLYQPPITSVQALYSATTSTGVFPSAGPPPGW